MERFRYDRSSKWLLTHHGDAILRLAGLTDIASWRPLQAEVVQPRTLPDGLLEVRRAGQPGPGLYVVEVCTFADNRAPDQLLKDVALVYADRGQLPEAVVAVLRPKGNVRVDDHVDLASPGGWTRWQASWRVVELWTVSAADLLATGDPGAMPWVPLARFDGPPEPVLRRCREIIDEKAKPEEHENLLAVTSVFTSLRYNDRSLLKVLGVKEMIEESWFLQELVSEKMHKATLAILQGRFGTPPGDVRVALEAVKDAERAGELNRFAALCPDLDAFRAELAASPQKA